MILSPSQVKAAETLAFAQGVQAEALMEHAGKGIADIVCQFHTKPGRLAVWGGKGNNAGDALVAARILSERGWQTEFFGAFPEENLGKLAAQKLAEFRETPQSTLCCPSSFVVLDGLLGIGARGPLQPEICTAIQAIQKLREEEGAWVLAVDIPTGLDGETGQPADLCIEADLTATIGFVKTGLLRDSATRSVGRLAWIPLPELVAKKGDPAQLITPELLRTWLPLRSFDSHKGLYGHVGILAGSRTFPGAARLCTHAALRAGAGYVTLFAPENLYSIVAGSLPPEAILRPIRSFREVLHQPLSALCIGPGLGKDNASEILEIVREAEIPTVVDADALNAVALEPKTLHACRNVRLLTPHPGEFARLAPHLATLPRREAAEAFVADYPVTLLLKGARTVIAERGVPSLFNSTGNPGMASGGMGDTLTGVCGALLAQGLQARQAAATGAWLCGRAAESAVFLHRQSPESLLASDVTQFLGRAFEHVHQAGSF
ncbi:MAG: hypothetical protein C5B47_07075 [Verrucomicrobia bacterium]|nr:MAG: hypothetical protein C5B47_07075 [Verrucomicrobiota bacterium]